MCLNDKIIVPECQYTWRLIGIFMQPGFGPQSLRSVTTVLHTSIDVHQLPLAMWPIKHPDLSRWWCVRATKMSNIREDFRGYADCSDVPGYQPHHSGDGIKWHQWVSRPRSRGSKGSSLTSNVWSSLMNLKELTRHLVFHPWVLPSLVFNLII